MKVDITVEDYTIILNALHYYKKVEKQGNFDLYTDEKINALREAVRCVLPDEIGGVQTAWKQEMLHIADELEQL